MHSSNLLCECYVLINGAKSSEMDLLWGSCSEAELSRDIHCLCPGSTHDQLLVCRALGNTTLSFLQTIQTFSICSSCRALGHTAACGLGPSFVACIGNYFSYPTELLFCISWAWISQKGHWQTNYLGLFPAHVFSSTFQQQLRKQGNKIEDPWALRRDEGWMDKISSCQNRSTWLWVLSKCHWTGWSNARNLQNFPL